MQALNIITADSPDEAPNYRAMGDVKAATLHTVVVVGNGTEDGNATVDFQFTDEQGNNFVAMLTGKLVRGIVSSVDGVEQRTSGGG